MKRTYRFYKNEMGWFIDLKWWPFSIGYLAMVAGADDLLDKLSNGSKDVTLKISTSKFKGYDDILKRVKIFGINSGAVYTPLHQELKTQIFEGQSMLWLCPVTLFVFLRYPKRIFYQVVEK